MIIKGSARAAPGELAHHLLRQDTNESVCVLDLWNVSSLTVPGALAELDGMGAGSRSKRTLYHASINTPVSEQLTPKQQVIARDHLAKKLGLEDQPFAVVQHVKAGRQHTHIVWSRIDVDTGKAISDSHNYRKHEEASRELEQLFGHERVLGAHVRDKATERRPQRGPSWGEHRQAERSGLTAAEAKAIVTIMWQTTTTGFDFCHRLEAEGFTVARGDRRDFVLIDQAGEIHGMTKRIEGVKAAGVRERMADMDPTQFPSVAEARKQVRERQQERDNAAAFGVVGTAERMRADELKREAEGGDRRRAPLSGTHQDIADAIFQLNRTMRSDIQATLSKSAEPPSPPATPKGDLFDEITRERANRTDAQKAANALRLQEERRRRDRTADYDR